MTGPMQPEPFAEPGPTTIAHPGVLDFDRALLGLVGTDFHSHLAACAECRLRLGALQEEQAAFAASDEPAQAARAIAERRAIRNAGRWWRRGFGLPALTAVAACGVLIVVMSGPFDRAGTRTKGGPTVMPYVRHGTAEPEALAPGTAINRSDAVQLAYQADGYSTMTLFSIDERCKPRLHHSGAAADHGVIPVSFRLDGTGGGGRIYAVFSHRAITAQDLGEALRSTPGGCDAASAPPGDGPKFAARGFVLNEAGTP